MEKFELVLRHRPSLNQSIEDKHSEFLAIAGGLPAPWGLTNIDECKLPKQEDNLATVIQLNRHLAKGLKGFVSYQLRAATYLKDNAQYDDILVLEFNPNKIDYALLVFDVFPKLINAFQAYRAVITSMNLAMEDWQTVVEKVNATGRDVDGRDGVFRISAVNFWDNLLCKRAFGMTPSEIVQRLSVSVPKAAILNDGAYVVSITSISNSGELATLDQHLRGALGISLS